MTRTSGPIGKNDLRPVPQAKTKWSALAIFIFLLVVILAISSKFTNGGTSLEITPAGNKFKLSFQIAKSDQDDFLRTLSQFSLPQNIKEGVEFELDATSSAALAFASPIKAKLSFGEKKIEIHGSTSSTSQSLFEAESFNLPQATKLAIFAPSIEDLIYSKLTIPPELTSFISNLFSQKGQLVAFYGDDFLVITKASRINFDDLNNLKITQEDQIYKKEQIEGSFETHLLKLPQKIEGQKSTLSIFQLGQWIFMTSSLDAARQIIQAQKSPDVIIFPKSKQQATLIVLIQNWDKDTAVPFAILPVGEKDWSNTLASFQKAEFTLKGSQFSGLINLK